MPTCPGTFASKGNYAGACGMAAKGARFSKGPKDITPGPYSLKGFGGGVSATIGAGSRFPQLSRQEKARELISLQHYASVPIFMTYGTHVASQTLT